MKVAFTGTQKGLSVLQFRALWNRLEELKPSAFIHGGCVGADEQADQIAVDQGILRFIFPQSSNPLKRVSDAAFKKRIDVYSMKQGNCVIMPAEPPLVRNVQIVKAGTILIACPKESNEVLRSGTWATIRQARKLLGLSNVEIIYP